MPTAQGDPAGDREASPVTPSASLLPPTAWAFCGSSEVSSELSTHSSLHADCGQTPQEGRQLGGLCTKGIREVR